jgi:hypothetical protein
MENVFSLDSSRELALRAVASILARDCRGRRTALVTPSLCPVRVRRVREAFVIRPGARGVFHSRSYLRPSRWSPT